MAKGKKRKDSNKNDIDAYRHEAEETMWRNFTVAEFMKGYPEKDAMYDSL